VQLCPQTTRLLEQVPGIRVAGFSRIQPRSGIDTHKGFTGTTRLLARDWHHRAVLSCHRPCAHGLCLWLWVVGRMYGALAYHLGLLIPSSGASLVCGPEGAPLRLALLLTVHCS
jgi:hypothetical protein